MVIEYLKFNVKADQRERFVQQDDEIWTSVLAAQPGFLEKEVWISPDHLTEVVIAIKWASFEQWQAISPEQLHATEEHFSAVMGDTYELVEATRYQIRKQRAV